ncbi:MAG: hypothetical protein R3240_08120 [Gammaproteobacteria bacterium]|nr:hypothetical protein [Gammaproteobacteria bacterium]
MNQLNMELVSYLVSITVGIVLLSSLIGTKIKHLPLRRYSVLSGIIGAMLIALPLWSSVNLAMHNESPVALYKESPQQILEPVQTVTYDLE